MSTTLNAIRSREKRIEALRKMLTAEGITPALFAETCGCCIRTAQERMRRPDTITLGELDLLRVRTGMRVRIVYDPMEF